MIHESIIGSWRYRRYNGDQNTKTVILQQSDNGEKLRGFAILGLHVEVSAGIYYLTLNNKLNSS
jgi:hypothetical protein